MCSLSSWLGARGRGSEPRVDAARSGSVLPFARRHGVWGTSKERTRSFAQKRCFGSSPHPSPLAPPPLKMSPAAIAGVIIFLLVWLSLLRDELPGLPLGRAQSATLGAALMVACGVLSPSAAFAAINLETLALLTGCMLVSAHLERQGLYATLVGALVAGGSAGGATPRVLLVRIGCVAALLSALITNDAAAVVLTPIVIAACRERKLPPMPHLMVLATSANIGSACSPIGNPQNMLIAAVGGVSFARLLAHVGLASVLGVALNIAIIARVYAAQLQPELRYEVLHGANSGAGGAGPGADARAAMFSAAASAAPAPVERHHDVSGGAAAAPDGTTAVAVSAPSAEAVVPSASGPPGDIVATLPPAAAAPISVAPQAPTPAAATHPPPAWPPHGSSRPRALAVRGILAVLPIVLVVGDRWVGLGWLSLLAAGALAVADGGPGAVTLRKVDGALLLFFAGLFVVVAGINATGVPDAAWDAVSARAGDVRSAAGAAMLVAVTLVGSNLFSNVPLILLLGPKVLALPPADQPLAWSLLAWAATVAGNLSLLGSVCNLIVAEGARSAGIELKAREYMRTGVPSTLLLVGFGSTIVWAMASAIVVP